MCIDKALKTLISLVLVGICLLSSFVVSANEPLEIQFGNVTTKVGEEAIIAVTIKNNSGIAGFRFRITYDSASLTFVSAEQGSALTTGTLVHDTNEAEQTVTFLWYATEDVVADGELVVLKFNVSDTAKGEYDLLVHYLPEDILNSAKKPLNAIVTNGRIMVQSILYGDLDDDDKVTAADALEVLKSVVGKVALTDDQFTAADTDGNGKADAADALNILKKVVGKIDKFPVEIA